jgi:hypothetical protein
VVIASEPLDAQVFEGDKDLGKCPVVLELPIDGEKTLEIRREGFKSQSITVDGSEPTRSIKLEKLSQAAPSRPERPVRGSTRPTQPAPERERKPKPVGGGEIVNPWE